MFEGIEKRLEIFFDIDESLRQTLTRKQWEQILDPVDCVIERELLTKTVDTYLLSASSLFVFDDRVVLKTCGETKVFEAIKGILTHTRNKAIAVKYTRGQYFFTEKQPEAYRDFEVESKALSGALEGFDNYVKEKLGLDERSKFYFFAAEPSLVSGTVSEANNYGVTIEILMKGLNREKANVFYLCNGAGRMTTDSGIGGIFPESEISDHEFNPCGYSMNGIQDHSVYTIHVTPEDEFSFASFEAYGFEFKQKGDFRKLVKKVVDCFGPSSFIVTVHATSSSTLDMVDLEDYERLCKYKEVKDLGKWGAMKYYSY